MTFQNITMNLTALQNISSPDINITGSGDLASIIGVANSSTNDLLIFAPMFIVLVVVYLALSDKGPFQEFGYDFARASCIALATSILIGITMIEVGWSNNFIAIGMFNAAWLVNIIGIFIYENVE